MEIGRKKFLDKEHQTKLEIEHLKQNLNLLHDAEIDEIIGKHDIQIGALREEIENLEGIIQSKSI